MIARGLWVLIATLVGCGGTTGSPPPTAGAASASRSSNAETLVTLAHRLERTTIGTLLGQSNDATWFATQGGANQLTWFDPPQPQPDLSAARVEGVLLELTVCGGTGPQRDIVGVAVLVIGEELRVFGARTVGAVSDCPAGREIPAVRDAIATWADDAMAGRALPWPRDTDVPDGSPLREAFAALAAGREQHHDLLKSLAPGAGIKVLGLGECWVLAVDDTHQYSIEVDLDPSDATFVVTAIKVKWQPRQAAAPAACAADPQHCCMPDGRLVRPGGCQPSYPDDVQGAVARGADGRCEPIECHLRCLPEQARIATPDGEIAISELHVGDVVISLDDSGAPVAVPIARIASVPHDGPHSVLELSLSDGRVVRASAAHPLADGRPIADLAVGGSLDGATLRAIRVVPYSGATWDLLPASETGAYFADGVLLGSTLSR